MSASFLVDGEPSPHSSVQISVKVAALRSGRRKENENNDGFKVHKRTQLPRWYRPICGQSTVGAGAALVTPDRQVIRGDSKTRCRKTPGFFVLIGLVAEMV